MPTRAQHGLGMLLICCVVAFAPLLTAPADAASNTANTRSTFGIRSLANGGLTLSHNASASPRPYKAYERYGLFISPVTSSKEPLRGVRVSFDLTLPRGTEIILGVRGHSAQGRWSEWIDDLSSEQDTLFSEPAVAYQYRAILLGSSSVAPSIHNIRLQALVGGVSALRKAKQQAVAPTYRLRVTREGMVGSHTANGHRIRRNDVYVSLPSWSALSSLGGHEYEVRLSANGHSIVAPVWDVGPWNHHDNYWDQDRLTYKDLPTGWPEDHAAYFEHYNHRMADEGWVRFPTAVDIGDGAYWALGLDGEQGVADVTFLWLGDDPGRHPTPLNEDAAHRPVLDAQQDITDPAGGRDSTATPTPADGVAADSVRVDAAAPQFDANTPVAHACKQSRVPSYPRFKLPGCVA